MFEFLFGKKNDRTDDEVKDYPLPGGDPWHHDTPTFKGVEDALSRYAEIEVVGPIARSALAEIQILENKQNALHAIIETRFPKGSLSYQKFVSTVDTAVDTILENTMTLSNRISLFDVDEYRKTRYLLASGAYKEDDIPDEIQEEKGEMFKVSREEMKAVIAANERLMLDLDRLGVELGKPDVEGAEAKNSEIADEIKQLIDEVKLYR